jgi:RecJ-like exonuclease
LDLGSGSLDLLSPLNSSDVFVFDHHPPVGSVFPRLCHVNPHLCGFDGSRELSGSGAAYLVAKALEASADLACLAVVGALGDSQDRFKERSLGGLNEDLVRDAEDSGYVRVEKKDLLLYGRETRPIHRAIAYTTNPYIPGLSGEEDKCLAFVVNLGIEVKRQDRWRALNDLSSEEKKLIYSGLVKHSRLPEKVALSLLGTEYTLVQEERGTSLRDGREYASLLNACGRMGKPGLGVAVSYGSRGSLLSEVTKLFGEYRKSLAEYLGLLEKDAERIKRLQNIYVVDGSGLIDELMLSTVTSVLISNGRFNEPRPVIALANASGGKVKVSGRLPEDLREAPLNLGSIFHEASGICRGIGGGHDVAAGATIPSGREVEFTRFIDEKVGSLLQHQRN